MPLGIIILLYNDANPNVNLPPMDISMADGNWSEGSTTGTSQETSGAPNNTTNAAYIGQFNNTCTPILPIDVTASSTPSDCGCIGTANATASGSLPGYTYQWTNALNVPIGQNTATATGLCAGSHF